MSMDDDGHATNEDSISSVQSEESNLAPLSPPGMIVRMYCSKGYMSLYN